MTYLLTGGILFDGTGRSPRPADVLIREGLIAAVGEVPGSSVPVDAVRLDVSGLAVAPGFIDIHSHSDTAVLSRPQADNIVRQGITTQVVGNCGSSPCHTGSWGEDTWARLAEQGVIRRWDGVEGYLRVVDEAAPSINIATLVGHGDIRTEVLGPGGAQPDDDELARMGRMAGESVAAGAFGMSAGLEYVPGRFGTVRELEACCQAVASRAGVFTCHLRNEGPQLLEAIEEVLEVTKSTGIRLEVSHLKACGQENWGKVRAALGLLAAARSQGLEVYPDFYPYLASFTELAIVLPDWALDAGKPEALRRLSDPALRMRAVREADRRTKRQGGWERVVLVRVALPGNRWMVGRDL
ncbi:MAG: amidohydrolase family protein, partial [Bacillota bacterium]